MLSVTVLVVVTFAVVVVAVSGVVEVASPGTGGSVIGIPVVWTGTSFTAAARAAAGDGS